jgi:3-deoxy-D-manno-octulosonate 8-phosphate phosphatase (KDO 8-P phosphatase)
MSTTLSARAQKIQLLILDVDGVLTDGSLYYSDNGIETKRFHVRDGSGLKLWQLTGKRAAVISGRTSAAVANRAMELGLSPVKQGCGADKRKAFGDVLAELNLQPEQCCAIGDDLPDLPLFLKCGLSIAVNDACPEIQQAASYITRSNGGRGAVREAVEWLLKLTGEWGDLVAKYS